MASSLDMVLIQLFHSFVEKWCMVVSSLDMVLIQFFHSFVEKGCKNLRIVGSSLDMFLIKFFNSFVKKGCSVLVSDRVVVLAKRQKERILEGFRNRLKT